MYCINFPLHSNPSLLLMAIKTNCPQFYPYADKLLYREEGCASNIFLLLNLKDGGETSANQKILMFSTVLSAFRFGHYCN